MKITPLENWTSRKLRIMERPNVRLLQEYQLDKLRETLELATSQSRFYSEHLRGVDPAAIQTMQDVARIPFTEPRILAGRFSDFLCVSPKDINRIVTLSTSGTTGRPKRVGFTPEDQELTVDFFHHGMTTLLNPCERVIIFMPGKTEGSVGDLLKKAVTRSGCEGMVFGPISDYGQALRALVDAKPDCAVGIPCQLLALSRHRESGMSAERIRLKNVLLSTDYVPRAVQEGLAQVWGCEVYSHYGMTEMGLGGAVECNARSGYHMREADLLFEIVDPNTDMPVGCGEYGEIVFSTLTRRGMPLIRYRTGDRSRFLPEPCPCGSVLRSLERISGRMNEAVRLFNGDFISIMQLDEVLLRDPCVSAYSAEIYRKEGCDCLGLTIQSARDAIDPERIAVALCKNSSIGDLIARKQVKLEIREGEAGYFTTGTAKRFIAERRT